MCLSEQDAVVASIRLSGLTLTEIAARCGVSKVAVCKWQRNGVPHRRIAAFQNATGVRLLQQYLDMERAMRIARGMVREQDRIAAMCAPTQQAWAIEQRGRAA